MKPLCSSRSRKKICMRSWKQGMAGTEGTADKKTGAAVYPAKVKRTRRGWMR